MTRWIAFDQDTVAGLRSQLPHDSVFEAPGRTVIDYAITTTRPVVGLLGPAGNDEVTIAVFRATWKGTAVHPEAAEPLLDAEVDDETPIRTSGFLGLSDTFAGADEEENTENKRWWQFWR